MRILVTGNRGQLVTALRAKSRDNVLITSLGRPELDLTRPETIDVAIRDFQPDLLISAAAYTAVDQAELEPESAHIVNAIAPGLMADTTRRLGIPMIHISTDYVFDGTTSSPYKETDRPNPHTVYGHTKLAGEHQVAHHNPDSIILRTSWAYSPYGKNFVRTILKLAGQQKNIQVVDDQIGNPTYMPHLADSILRIAEEMFIGRAPPGIYHSSASGHVSWAGFAQAIIDGSRSRGAKGASVVPVPSSEFPHLARRPKNSRLDCSKLESIFGIVMPSWELGLDQCLDELVRN